MIHTTTLTPVGFETAKALFCLKYEFRPTRAFMSQNNYDLLRLQGWSLGLSVENVEPQRHRAGDLVFELPEKYPNDEFELEANGKTELFRISTPDSEFAKTQFRSAMVTLRHYAKQGDADLGARMYREINRDVIGPLSQRADVKKVLAKGNQVDIDSEPKTE